jgi:hypothetical protein
MHLPALPTIAADLKASTASTQIVSAVFDGTARPMVITVALCAIGALLLSVATMGRRELVPQLAE